MEILKVLADARSWADDATTAADNEAIEPELKDILNELAWYMNTLAGLLGGGSGPDQDGVASPWPPGLREPPSG